MVVHHIFGNLVKDLIECDFSTENISFLSLGIGFIVSFISQVFAWRWLISGVRNSQLSYFAWDFIVIGIVGALYALFT